MHAISEVIEQLKEKYLKQQPIPAEPEIPDFINNEDTLVVTKVKNAYKVDSLKERKSYMVSKINNKVYCSCEHGQEEKHCIHKIEVWRESKRLMKLRVDECIKRKIGANIGQYIHRIRQIVEDYERKGDTQNCSYYYYKGKLSGLKLNLRIVIEA